jgi:hypothetical protein
MLRPASLSMTVATPATQSHGGILFPLDMFRPTVLAQALAEVLIGKVRNIVDATVEIARHPSLPLALAQIYGTVVGDDPAEFWRENQDLALVVSQLIPRQCFVYYARTGEHAREGFLVAQRGQAIAADDSNRDDVPPGKAGTHWPVTRLCEQMRISIEDLAESFPGGPRIQISLMEPRGNDQTLLMTLVGQPATDAAEAELEGDEGFDEPPPPPPPPSRGGGLTQGFGAPPPPSAAPSRSPAAPAARTAPAAAKPPGISAIDDAKRRASERAAEQQEIQQRSQQIAQKLNFAEDALGVVIAVPAELAETAVLQPFHIPHVERNAPESLPADVRERLEGKAVDFAVRVEFLSEVLLGNQPLARPKFEEKASTRDLDGLQVQALEVLAPRLGAGTLLRSNGRNVFVSRRADAPLPAAFLRKVLES